MAYNIDHGGVTAILNTTSTGAGEWYRVHPKMGKLTFQVLQSGASVGTTMSSSCEIEASNDGVNALDTALGTVSFSSVATPNTDGFATDAGWQYVRAKLNSLSTSTSSTGANSVQVYVSGQVRS